MTIEVRTPCRLHFGLLAYSRGGDRQFGGAGLMVRRPHVAVRVEQAGRFTATGPMAKRAVRFAKRFIERAGVEDVSGATIEVLHGPRGHVGLGSGTQLAMAVGYAIAHLAKIGPVDAPTLSHFVGRGQRSAIGAYGFFTGGLIVEGGKVDPDVLSPLVLRQPCPQHWRFVLICPRRLEGLAGSHEVQAFSQMPDIPQSRTAEMCRLVLLGLVPAMSDDDVNGFGEALYELQQHVGDCFRQAQGGVYADPQLTSIVSFVRDQQVRGVGQSSWGPTLYAATADDDRAAHLVRALRSKFDLTDDEVFISEPDNQGVQITADATPISRLDQPMTELRKN